MRSLMVAVFALSSFSLIAGAQDDAAQQAAQQAMEAAQQANQQAMEAMRQASDQAMQANQQAMQDAQQAASNANNCCQPQYAAMPSFSVKAGTYSAGTIVRMTDSSRNAVMYYTTDGWRPTTKSARYTGPITLTRTTTLQAIAIAPECRPSLVSSAAYTVPGTHPPENQPERIPVLAPGIMLPLTFTSIVSSKGLQIGDTLPVALAQDLYVGGVLVAPKNTAVLTTVMGVNHPGAGGAPGGITFEAHSITLTNGETIPLSGGESKDGRMRTKAVKALILIPVVGMGALFIHGEEAQIPKGAKFTAYVDSAAPPLTANAVHPEGEQPVGPVSR